MRSSVLLGLCLVLFQLVFPWHAEAQLNLPSRYTAAGDRGSELRSPRLIQYARGGEEEVSSALSPAFFKSALIPGWGQFSQGKHLRAAIFLGIELAGITGHLVYQNKFQDRKEVYEDHAREYWKLDRWLRFYDPKSDPSTHDMPVTCSNEEHEWHYPSEAGEIPCSQSEWEVVWNHEAYENAYKYDQFMAGWYDPENPDRGYDPANPDDALEGKLSPLRRENKEMREEANAMGEYARMFVFGVMANHLISAFETVFWKPEQQESTRARLDIHYRAVVLGGTPHTTLSAAYHW